MLLPLGTASIPDTIGNLLVRWCKWSPLDRRVTVRVEFSDDPYLVGREFDGSIRGFDSASGGLLIVLTDLLSRRNNFIDIVVAAPILRWHGMGRLLLLWSAVRLVDLSSLADEDYSATIGTGRLRLQLGGRKTRR